MIDVPVRTIACCLVLMFTIVVPAASADEMLSPAPFDSFSIVVIPDTQAYHGAGVKGGDPKNTSPVTNPIFHSHVRWIVDNLDRQRIAFVSHVGDIVDIDRDDQWKVARECMDMLHGKIPYGISVGNHDMTTKGDSTLFQKYFPQSRFKDFPWYGGSYEGWPTDRRISGNNANSFQLFSAGGMDFVFLHLECNAPDDVLDWANGVLETHSHRCALITCHMGWGPLNQPKTNEEFITAEKGRMTWSKIHGPRGNSPQQIWEKCYRKHRNLACVFSGDQSRTQAMYAATPGDHGNVIHEILQDYGSGWLRLIRFLPSTKRVDVMTFDPRTEILCAGTALVPSPNAHHFHFSIDPPLSSANGK